MLVTLSVFFGALYYLFRLTVAQSVALLDDDDFTETFKQQVVRLREALAQNDIYIAELDDLADIPSVNETTEDHPTIQELASLLEHLESVADLFADIPFMLIMLVCMLFARQPKSAAEAITPPHLMSMSEQIESQVGSYIISKFGLSLATGTLTWFFLWYYNIRLAVLFGILACVLNFIPSLGSVWHTVLCYSMLCSYTMLLQCWSSNVWWLPIAYFYLTAHAADHCHRASSATYHM